jgi:sirohydrochlorin ferrochelatase
MGAPVRNGRSVTSALFALAAGQWHTMRAEYEVVREAAYERAETACNGRLLNARGKAARVDPYSLFMGPAVRAYAYASEELIEHWTKYPRLTLADYEHQMLERETA